MAQSHDNTSIGAEQNSKTEKDAKPVNLHDRIKREDVEKSLQEYKGPSAKLESFTVKDFTKKTDNYMGFVTSISVAYSQSGKQHETSLVAKLNPASSGMQTFFGSKAFMKEIGFYSQIIPELNKELAKLGERKLHTPRFLHAVLVEKSEIIYFDDQRNENFKMFDRMKGMDKAHTELIINELARWHAASHFFLSRTENRNIDIIQKYPCLQELFDSDETEEKKEQGWSDFTQSTVHMANAHEGYEYVAKYLKEKGQCYKLFSSQLKDTNLANVISHGDCWINNLLFR